jgi:hypothetical protein
MNAKTSTLLFALLLVILAPFVFSQAQNATVTLKGIVSETTLLSNNDLHVWLQNDRVGSEVCLGSSRFLEGQGFLPGVGDSIEVTGTRTGNGSLLVATSLQKGGKTLSLPGTSQPLSSPGANHHCCCGNNDCGSDGHHCSHHHHGHCCDHD